MELRLNRLNKPKESNKPNEPNELNKPQYLFNALLSALCAMLLLVSSTVRAELADVFKYFQPYISVQEEYNSNINWTSTNEIDDFITTFSPGFRFSTLPRAEATRVRQAPTAEKKFGIDLDLNAGLVFHAKEGDLNYTSLNGLLNVWYLPTQRLAFRVRDYLVRSDALREPDYSATAIEGQYLLSRSRERVVYARNVAEPSIQYQFGRDSRISLNYRNNIFKIQSQTFQDSQENYINPRLNYWFNIRHGITLEYALTLGDFERSPDLTGHLGTARYTYRFSPRTSVFGEYTYLFRDFDRPSIDYTIRRPSLGVEHAFSRTLTSSIQAGYYWQDPERGSGKDGVFYEVKIIQRAEKTTYVLLLQGGYTEDYFTTENLGFNKYYRAIGSIDFQLLEKMRVTPFGSYERAKYYGDSADTRRRVDNIWAIGVTGVYELFRWLTLSLDGSYRENHSNIDTADYNIYRGIFKITASF